LSTSLTPGGLSPRLRLCVRLTADPPRKIDGQAWVWRDVAGFLSPKVEIHVPSARPPAFPAGQLTSDSTRCVGHESLPAYRSPELPTTGRSRRSSGPGEAREVFRHEGRQGRRGIHRVRSEPAGASPRPDPDALSNRPARCRPLRIRSRARKAPRGDESPPVIGGGNSLADSADAFVVLSIRCQTAPRDPGRRPGRGSSQYSKLADE
jgi:hypothetical protein